ncbi:EAL domain-containing protein [Alkalihalobacillus hemicellulosilyticus]|uniref:Diguanylate cyclase/phosphodiesterase n=1 Tax=Halalkalibacter hemicellulosilyticusJCM 9152 TaxID=1236971 RepID=W4QEL3_9BACI|nr:EAL domain-containing protein [Halalkalibacter hemicellulosilyticus]GAE30377.1 diguanylate cyclase/phosphodiesterase [Halalkalibacter hemicellulosilyticusJCM 9152]
MTINKGDRMSKDSRLTKEELLAVMHNVQDAIFVIALNKELKIEGFVEVNEAACKQLKYSRKELLSLSPLDIIDPSALHFIYKELQDIMYGKSITIDSMLMTKERERIPVVMSHRMVEMVEDHKFIVCTVRDHRKPGEIQRLLDKVIKQYDSLFYFHPDFVFSLDEKGAITNLNPAGELMLKYELSELIGKSFEIMIPHDEQEKTKDAFQKNIQGQTMQFESAIVNKLQQRIDLNVTSVPIILHDQVIGIIGIARNVTLQNKTKRLLEESEQRYRSLFEFNVDAVLTLDLEGRFLEVNQATERLTGYHADELLEKSFLPLIVPEDRERTFHHFQKALEGNPQQYETSMYNKNDEKMYFHITIIPIFIDRILTGIHCIGKDITEKKRIEEKMNYLAFHDSLTELPNQRLFRFEGNQALKEAKEKRGMIAVCFLDLDRFKFINDYLGHEIGDLLLQKVANRLEKVLKDKGRAFRYGGDEFILLLKNTSEVEVLSTAKNVIENISKPFNLNGFEAVVTASMGISLYPHHGETPFTLIKKADNAMYHAKRQGKNNFQIYGSYVRGMTNGNLKLETLMHKALEQQELLLLYQPQMDAKTNTIYGVEGLIRWNNDELGMVSPQEFIPVAEETGLIVPIGEWVIRTACKQNKEWQQKGLSPIVVSVNLSIRQFYQSDLIEKIDAILKETQLDPCFLELEITESMAMHADTAIVILTELKKLGVKIAIDDFGTGYSSLNYLKRFPIDHLKVDRSFVKDIQVDDDRDIITTIIALGHNLKMKVIAEGVETKEQVAFLKKAKCDILQGYYYSKPLDSKMIEEMLLHQS